MARTKVRILDAAPLFIYSAANTHLCTLTAISGMVVISGNAGNKVYVGGNKDYDGGYAVVQSESYVKKTPVLALKTSYTAAADPIHENYYQFRTVTTDANPTHVASFGIDKSGTFSLDGKIIAMGHETANRLRVSGAEYSFRATYTYNSGRGLEVTDGSPTIVALAEDNTAWDVSMGTIGTTGASINVQGDTSQTVYWHTHVKVAEVLLY